MPIPESCGSISLESSHGNTWGQSSTFTVDLDGVGSWSAELTLNPGTGAKLNAPSAFMKTFVGKVVGGVEPLKLPPELSGPSGRYLLGAVVPVSGNLNYVFPYAVGRAPRNGEAVTLMDPVTKRFTTSTFSSVTGWDHDQTLTVSQAAFFDIIQVPEPSVAALGLLGLAMLGFRKR